jgi:hypothetical protein
MSLATEQTYRNAVPLAEGTRQQSKAAAFVTYGYVAANLATYKVALADADVAYVTSVNTAFDLRGVILTGSTRASPGQVMSFAIIAPDPLPGPGLLF